MKKESFYLILSFLFAATGCVTNVEGQRTNSKAVAFMATEDIELVVGTGESLPLFSQADKKVMTWADQEFTVSIPLSQTDEQWRISKVTEPEIIMLTKEMKYEKDWVFTFKALKKGSSRIILSCRNQESGLTKFEIIDVNVE